MRIEQHEGRLLLLWVVTRTTPGVIRRGSIYGEPCHAARVFVDYDEMPEGRCKAATSGRNARGIRLVSRP